MDRRKDAILDALAVFLIIVIVSAVITFIDQAATVLR
jgi:hypothetical protein